MDRYEKDAFSNGFYFVAGIDEAGRGPLAGPVVAAAVIFSPGSPIPQGIADSKKLTPARRETLATEIFASATGIGVGLSWPEEIDRINILQATFRAMERAVLSISFLPPLNATSVKSPCDRRIDPPAPQLLLIDGPYTINLEIPQISIVKGDNLSVSIAAASIIAKTLRDRIMVGYASLYPEYRFEKNKGYGTRDHLRALHKCGPLPIHRKSFNFPAPR